MVLGRLATLQFRAAIRDAIGRQVIVPADAGLPAYTEYDGEKFTGYLARNYPFEASSVARLTRVRPHRC